jgi:hypothetical protein
MREGVAGLVRDKIRKPGLPPLPLTVVDPVVALTLGDPPGATTHGTGRAMAAASGVALRSVQCIWAAHGLQPHRFAHMLYPLPGWACGPSGPARDDAVGVSRDGFGLAEYGRPCTLEATRPPPADVPACQATGRRGASERRAGLGGLTVEAAVLRHRPDQAVAGNF